MSSNLKTDGKFPPVLNKYSFSFQRLIDFGNYFCDSAKKKLYTPAVHPSISCVSYSRSAALPLSS